MQERAGLTMWPDPDTFSKTERAMKPLALRVSHASSDFARSPEKNVSFLLLAGRLAATEIPAADLGRRKIHPLFHAALERFRGETAFDVFRIAWNSQRIFKARQHLLPACAVRL